MLNRLDFRLPISACIADIGSVAGVGGGERTEWADSVAWAHAERFGSEGPGEYKRDGVHEDDRLAGGIRDRSRRGVNAGDLPIERDPERIIVDDESRIEWTSFQCTAVGMAGVE